MKSNNRIVNLNQISIFLLAVLIFIIPVYATPPISASNGQISVVGGPTTLNVANGQIDVVGGTTTLNVALSGISNGISGYNITVSLSDPGVAEIVSVEFPAWANLTNNSSLPSDSLWIKALDLNKITKGSTNVLLATLTVRGDSNGSTEVRPIVNQIDGDNGSIIDPAITSGQLDVGPSQIIKMADSFGVDNANGNPNMFVLVPVKISNTQNGPIAGVIFDISFDSNVINLTRARVQRGDLSSSWELPSYNPSNSRISIVYGGSGTEISNSTSGSVIILNFSVVGSSGAYSSMNISRIQLSNIDGTLGTAPSKNATFSVSIKGDLNNNGVSADAGDLVLMKRASIGEIPADLRYDLNNNGFFADAGDLVLMKRASIGEIIL